VIANLAASIHARLLARAKKRGEDFNLVLTRYGLERFLYRLSVSPARDHYLRKGALLEPTRRRLRATCRNDHARVRRDAS